MRRSTFPLLLALVALCGCDDLKIKSDSSFHYKGSLQATLFYKDNPVPDDPTKGSCTWTVDGADIGTGTTVTVSGLMPGKHELVAHVVASGKSDDVKKKIEVVNDKPVPAIAALGAKSFDVGTTIALSGSATDREDGALDGAGLVWKVDGQVRGAGASVALSDLTPGKRKLELVAKDSAGAEGSTKLELTITNRAPSVTIEGPDDGSETPVYKKVVFKGSALDPDPLHSPGRVPGDRLEWVSSRQGSLGQGEVLEVSSLIPGEHTVELRAKDEFGLVGKASVKITVANRAPEVRIVRPSSGDSFDVGAEVKLEAEASDPEDPVLPDDKVRWHSQLDGDLGTGRKLATKKLRPGLHEITCTATDHFGASSTAKLSLVVKNDPPVVTITAPADGASYTGGDATITFEGKAKAPVQGDLDGGALTWLSEAGKKLGDGRKLRVDGKKLGFGTHSVTLRAKDKWGAESAATIHVTVVERPPEVSILSPADGSSFDQGAVVTFTGTGRDPEKGKPLAGSQLEWTTTHNFAVAKLGTGAKVSLATLDPGVHEITLTARSANDPTLTRVATVRVRIVPATTATPAATTTAPAAPPSSTPGIVGTLGDSR